MDINEFLREHEMTLADLSTICRTTTQTIKRYIKQEPIKTSLKVKIESGLYVIDNYSLYGKIDLESNLPTSHSKWACEEDREEKIKKHKETINLAMKLTEDEYSWRMWMEEPDMFK